MGEEFQAGIFGGNWWNPTRSLFSGAAASPCSLGLGNDVAGFGWPSHDCIDNIADTNSNNKTRSNNSSGDTNKSVCESPNIAFQEVLQKPHNNQMSSPICGTNNSLISDDSLQIMGFGLSPSDFFEPNIARSSGRTSESSDVYAMLQEDNQIQTALSSGFPVSSGSYGYSPAALLQSLFSDEPHQNPFPGNNYSSNTNASDWQRNVSTLPKQLSHQQGGLHFSNDTPFWNASEQVIGNQIRPSLNFLPASASQLYHHQYASPTFDQKPKSINSPATKSNNIPSNKDQRNSETSSSCGVKKSSTGNEQPAFKRARLETPSPLPTFKVRKEKLGDRITALQQLVSPFGKTDTASVLHEAIEYIKFLHDQVSVLSTPYMKNGAPSVQAHQQGSNKFMKTQESAKQDLKSRGLCLVPISSTFPVANETTADFWTPTFGGTFR